MQCRPIGDSYFYAIHKPCTSLFKILVRPMDVMPNRLLYRKWFSQYHAGPIGQLYQSVLGSPKDGACYMHVMQERDQRPSINSLKSLNLSCRSSYIVVKGSKKRDCNPPEVPNVKSTFSISLQHSQELRWIIEVAIV